MVFATHALSPAKITRVSIIDPVEKHMEVIVDDTQLSLAIGKKGQNVRLAAKLLGWKIDIKSEEEKRQEVETAMAALVPAGAPVSVLIDHGLAEKIVEKLHRSERRHGGETRLHDARGVGGNSGDRSAGSREDSGRCKRLLRPVRDRGGGSAGGAEAGSAEAEAVLAPAEEAESDRKPASVAAGNSSEEKKEFDTIENSEGVG